MRMIFVSIIYLIFQSLAHFIQATLDGAVHLAAVIAQAYAAQHGRIDLTKKRDFLACEGSELVRQTDFLGITEGNRRKDLHLQNALVSIVLLPVSFAAFRETADMVLLRQQLAKIQYIGLHLPPEALFQKVKPLLQGDIVGGKKLQKFRVFAKYGLRNRQLTQNLFL